MAVKSFIAKDVYKYFQESQREGESSFSFKRKRLQTMDYSDLAMGVQNRPNFSVR